MQLSTPTQILSLLTIISTAAAQTTTETGASPGASPDGLIVPFSSGLPVCASKCGPLFDVQGRCSPPNLGAIDLSCFCTDSRLTVFNNDAGVSLVCGPQSCTEPADMAAVKNWYDGVCRQGTVASTTASNVAVATSGQTQTNSSRPRPTAQQHATWISTHYQWVIMILVIFFAMVFGWIGACLLRRRYLRKKEREIEMNQPVAWGPHQMQGATGGYNYDNGVADPSRDEQMGASGHAKEFTAVSVTPSDGRKAKRETKGLRKNRFT